MFGNGESQNEESAVDLSKDSEVLKAMVKQTTSPPHQRQKRLKAIKSRHGEKKEKGEQR